jgi:predicted nuclease of predicted toxin-antitoxin system
MTRLLLDENYPRSAAQGLVVAGHEVVEVACTAAGMVDVAVMALALRDQRVLVTFDSDFGDLVFHQGAEPPPAIVYLRLHPIVSEEVQALTLLALQHPWDGSLVVVTRDSLRRRRFPRPTGGCVG